MKNDILNRLRNGESLDDITKSITEELNKANKLFEEEKKTKQEVAEKEASLDVILKELYDWFDKWYPDSLDERPTAKKILDFWDNIETYAKRITDNGKTKRTTVAKNGKISTKEEPSSFFDFMEKFF